MRNGKVLCAEVFLHQTFGLRLQLFRGTFQIRRSLNVKNQVCVCGTGYNAEVMQSNTWVNLFEQFGYFRAEPVRFRVIDGNGIHVDYSGAVQLLREPFFRIVDNVMDFIDVGIIRDFGMQRNHRAPGTVIVNNQVMDGVNFRIGKNNFLDAVDKFRFGGLPEKRVDGILCRLKAGKQDQPGNDETAPSVNCDRGEVADDSGNQYKGSGNAVT